MFIINLWLSIVKEGGTRMNSNDSNDSNDKQTIFKEEGENTELMKQTSSMGLEQNIAGLLCYLAGFITGIIFYVIEKENHFVRFHAMQSMIVFLSIFVISIVLSFIPVIGWVLGLLIAPVSFILWIFLMYKAYQNELYKLPFVGDIAEQQVNK